MVVNLNKSAKDWEEDIKTSVKMYNDWFTANAPRVFSSAREKAINDVKEALEASGYLTNLNAALIRQYPGILPTLRMATCPQLAVDRLIGLAGVPVSMVKRMEQEGKLPVKMEKEEVDANLEKICGLILKMADPDLFDWLSKKKAPDGSQVNRAATIVADRLCGSVANPIIRNAQERRQLDVIATWLQARGYRRHLGGNSDFRTMLPGTYSFRMNVPVGGDNGSNAINIPIDAVIMRQSAKSGDFPLLVEAKSAGDFTNTNKRRKEEAQKMNQLRHSYGDRIEFILFLCGYFGSGYLGYEAAEAIDWVWEHRIDDFQNFGL
jgi:hypothetical protein